MIKLIKILYDEEIDKLDKGDVVRFLPNKRFPVKFKSTSVFDRRIQDNLYFLTVSEAGPKLEIKYRRGDLYHLNSGEITTLPGSVITIQRIIERDPQYLGVFPILEEIVKSRQP